MQNFNKRNYSPSKANVTEFGLSIFLTWKPLDHQSFLAKFNLMQSQ